MQLREDKERGVFIDKARSVFVTSVEETLEVIATGAENREMAATGMNAGSSRSHSVLIITVRQKNLEDEATKQAKLVLVDLAGSESVGKTGAVGQQLEEAKMINKSLSSLNLV
jgi:kinesin family protein 5